MAIDVDAAIERAFRDALQPEERLTDATSGEPVDDTEPFKGKRWQEINSEILSRHHYALSWFTPEAFQYYLPAFLRSGLTDPKAVYVISLLLFLKPTEDPVLASFRRQRWEQLTEAQIEALENWLQWLVDHSKPSVKEEFEDALSVVRDRYWW